VQEAISKPKFPAFPAWLDSLHTSDMER